MIWDRRQVGFTWVWRRQMVFWARRTGGGGGEQLLHNQPLCLPPVFNCCCDCDQVWSIINNCIAYFTAWSDQIISECKHLISLSVQMYLILWLVIGSCVINTTFDQRKQFPPTRDWDWCKTLPHHTVQCQPRFEDFFNHPFQDAAHYYLADFFLLRGSLNSCASKTENNLGIIISKKRAFWPKNT